MENAQALLPRSRRSSKMDRLARCGSARLQEPLFVEKLACSPNVSFPAWT